MSQEKKRDVDPAEMLSGTLNLFGLKIDLGELLASPEEVKGRLEELRERLKAAGGKETSSDQEWKAGGVHVSGQIHTRGILGEQEYHLGTSGKASARRTPPPGPPEAVEPPLDLFDEGDEVTVIADVPGVNMDDLDVKVEGRQVVISTKPAVRRGYRKELRLNAEVDPQSLQATCNNGVLELRLRKRPAGDT